MALGGMSASSTGGFKVFRLLAVLSYSRRRLFRQLHPRAVNIIRFGSEVVSEATVARVVGFFGLFMAVAGVATFLVAALGADMVTAISSVASAIGNVGPALGDAGPPGSFAVLSAPARWVLAVVMLIGRLEVFPVILGAVPVVRLVADHLPRRVTRAFLRWFRG
jgi:trk system potassium uptake protein TrkH